MPEPCGACRACLKSAASARPERLAEMRQEADRHPDEDVWRNFRLHPDLVLAEGWWLTRTGRPRSAPEIRVDQVRDLVREIAGAPFEARRRVFVIDDAHTMNESAQNALLKSLEEPAPRSHVILVSSGDLGPAAHDPLALPAAAFRAALARRDRRQAGAEGVSSEAAQLKAALAGGSLGAAASPEADAELRQRDELVALLEQASTGFATSRLEAAEALEQAEDPALAADDAAGAAARPGGAPRGRRPAGAR